MKPINSLHSVGKMQSYWMSVQVLHIVTTVFKGLRVCEISGSQGGEYENDSFLGYCAVQSRRIWQLFQRWVGAYWFIALMMEAERTSETSVNFCETIWRNIPEGCHLRLTVCFHDFFISSLTNVEPESSMWLIPKAIIGHNPEPVPASNPLCCYST
jgi:hypothetical protein